MALGLDAQCQEALKLLGDIRNSFSHNLNASLTDSKINELFSKLPSQAQELVHTAYVMTIEQRGEMDAPPFSKLSPKDRFILVAVVLKSFVVARAHEANSIQNVP